MVRLLLVVLVMAAGYAILKKHIRWTEDGTLSVSSDIISYLEASSAMLNGTDIYHRASGERNSYVYPPFLAFCLIPATFVHPLIIDVCWYVLNVGLLVLILSWGYSLLAGLSFRSLSLRHKMLFALLPSVLAIRYIVRNMQDANVNIMLLALIIGGTILVERRQNPRWALLVGIAAAIKILPALILLYYGARHKWREAMYMVAAAVGATLLPVLWLGTDRLYSYLRFFLSYASDQFSAKGLPIENFSFWGLAGRLLTSTIAFVSTRGEPVAVNIADFDLESVRVGITILLLGIITCLAWILHRYSSMDRGTPRFPRYGDLVLTILLMNMLSILIQDHHTVSFVLAMQYVIVASWAIVRHRPLLMVIIVTCGLLSTLISYDVIVPIWGKDFYARLLAWSVPVLPVGVALVVTTAWVMLWGERADAGQEPSRMVKTATV